MRGGDDHKPSVAAAQKMILLMATHWKVVLHGCYNNTYSIKHHIR